MCSTKISDCPDETVEQDDRSPLIDTPTSVEAIEHEVNWEVACELGEPFLQPIRPDRMQDGIDLLASLKPGTRLGSFIQFSDGFG